MTSTSDTPSDPSSPGSAPTDDATPGESRTPRGRADFMPTRWSLVLAAGAEPDAGETSGAHRALSTLCESYWYPLYAFARCRGQGRTEAEDLVQGFFARVIEKHDLGAADPARGRFRAFLLTAFKHYVANQRKAAAALKRGGGKKLLSLDLDDADRRYLHEPSHDETAERLFDRSWALAVLGRAMERLAQDYADRGRGTLYEVLAPSLGGEEFDTGEAAEELGLTEGAVRVAVHRLRAAYGKALRAEIRETVADPGEVEDELASLMESLAL